MKATVHTGSARMASRLAAALLICVNLGVAVYALTQRFGYADLLLVYWAETVVIGLLNVPKLIIVALFGEQIQTLEGLRDALQRLAAVLLMILAYIVIFSLLWGLLYVLITALPMTLERSDRAAGLAVPRGPRHSGIRIDVVIYALALVHAVSFVVNFLFGREFRGGSLLRLAVQPVLRTGLIIAVIVLALIVAYVQPVLSKSMMFTLVVIGAKIAVDLKAHLAERRRFRLHPAVP